MDRGCDEIKKFFFRAHNVRHQQLIGGPYREPNVCMNVGVRNTNALQIFPSPKYGRLMGVATTCHESRIVTTTSHDVEKHAGPARTFPDFYQLSLDKYVIRIPVVSMNSFQYVLRPATQSSRLGESSPTTAGKFPSKLDEGDRGCKELSPPITD